MRGAHYHMEIRNYSFMFNFEERFRHEDSMAWMAKNWTLGLHVCGLYVILIFCGQRYMQKRNRFNLRSALCIWNSLLATFSILGVFRTAPELIHVLRSYGVYYSVCIPSYIELDRVSGVWTFLFALSKLPELGDTLFIVLRKQPLIFLHWYHHITVLLYTWYSFTEYIASGRWFVVNNYFVHSLMYSYYALRAYGRRPPRSLAMVITSCQIVQMVVGFALNLLSAHYLSSRQFCSTSYSNIALSSAMYLSYFLLFLMFFYKTYVDKSGRKSPKNISNGHSTSQKDK